MGCLSTHLMFVSRYNRINKPDIKEVPIDLQILRTLIACLPAARFIDSLDVEVGVRLMIGPYLNYCN
jgi:hypothetical protein